MPQLDDPLRIEQPFLDRPAEGGAVGEAAAAEITVIGVGMRIEMHHAERPEPGRRAVDAAQDGQRDQVVAARGQRPGAAGAEFGDPRLDRLERAHQVHRVGIDVADIGDAAQPVGLGARHRMHPAQHRRHLPHLPRPVPRARAVGGAAVEGDAEQRDIQPGGVGAHWQAHEAGRPGEARGDGAVEWLWPRIAVCHAAPGTKPHTGRAGGVGKLRRPPENPVVAARPMVYCAAQQSVRSRATRGTSPCPLRPTNA